MAAGDSRRTGAHPISGPDRAPEDPTAGGGGEQLRTQAHPERGPAGPDGLGQEGELLSARGVAVVTVGRHGATHDDQRIEAVERLGEGLAGVGPPLVDLDPGGGQSLADGVGGLGLEVLDDKTGRHGTTLSLRDQRRADRSRRGDPA